MNSVNTPTVSGMVSKPAQLPVPSIMDRLEATVQSQGLKVMARIDHSGAAQQAGLIMRPSQLLIFGNPLGGTPLMIAAPSTAIDLPLKVLAWEDADGKTWLSYNSMDYLKERHQIKGQEEQLSRLSRVLDAITDEANRA